MSLMSTVFNITQSLSNYASVDLLSSYATNDALRTNIEGVLTNVNSVASNVSDMSDDLYALNAEIDEISARLCGNVDLKNVSAIVTSIVSSYIHDDSQEEDYSDIYNSISDFNDGF